MATSENAGRSPLSYLVWIPLLIGVTQVVDDIVHMNHDDGQSFFHRKTLIDELGTGAPDPGDDEFRNLINRLIMYAGIPVSVLCNHLFIDEKTLKKIRKGRWSPPGGTRAGMMERILELLRG